MGRGAIGAADDDLTGPRRPASRASCASSTCRESEPIVVRNLGRGGLGGGRFDPVSGAQELRATSAPMRRSMALPAARRKRPRLGAHPGEEPKRPTTGPQPRALRTRRLTLANDQLAWHFDWSDGRLRSTGFENKLSGHRFALSAVQELGSASPRRRTVWRSRSFSRRF